MALPQANARLTKVAGGGFAEDYDRAAGADTAKWTGAVDAYYQEKRERVSQGGTTTLIRRRSLIVANSTPVEFAEGDTLTFTFRGTELTADVEVIERRELAGVGGVATTRLTLEEA